MREVIFYRAEMCELSENLSLTRDAWDVACLLYSSKQNDAKADNRPHEFVPRTGSGVRWQISSLCYTINCCTYNQSSNSGKWLTVLLTNWRPLSHTLKFWQAIATSTAQTWSLFRLQSASTLHINLYLQTNRRYFTRSSYDGKYSSSL